MKDENFCGLIALALVLISAVQFWNVETNFWTSFSFLFTCLGVSFLTGRAQAYSKINQKKRKKKRNAN